jgi:hypothetical protein
VPENGNIPRCANTWRSYRIWPGINSEFPYSVIEGIRNDVERRELLMNRPSYRGCCDLPTVKAALTVTCGVGIY